MTEPLRPTPKDLARRLEEHRPELTQPYIPSIELSPRTHRAELKGTAIGRLIIENKVELPESVQRILRQERAVLHSHRAAMMYIGFQAMGHYAGRKIKGTEHVDAALARIQPYGSRNMYVSRNSLALSGANSSETTQSFNLYATIANLTTGGRPSRIDVFEKRTLDKAFDIQSTVVRPNIWFGYLNLPAGSDSAEELVNLLDQTIAEDMTVGPLELIGRRSS